MVILILLRVGRGSHHSVRGGWRVRGVVRGLRIHMERTAGLRGANLGGGLLLVVILTGITFGSMVFMHRFGNLFRVMA